MLLSTWIAPSWCLFMTSYYPISSKGSLQCMAFVGFYVLDSCALTLCAGTS